LGVGSGTIVRVDVGSIVTVGVLEGYGVTVVNTKLGKGVGLKPLVGVLPSCGVSETVEILVG